MHVEPKGALPSGWLLPHHGSAPCPPATTSLPRTAAPPAPAPSWTTPTERGKPPTGRVRPSSAVFGVLLAPKKHARSTRWLRNSSTPATRHARNDPQVPPKAPDRLTTRTGRAPVPPDAPHGPVGLRHAPLCGCKRVCRPLWASHARKRGGYWPRQAPLGPQQPPGAEKGLGLRTVPPADRPAPAGPPERAPWTPSEDLGRNPGACNGFCDPHAQARRAGGERPGRPAGRRADGLDRGGHAGTTAGAGRGRWAGLRPRQGGARAARGGPIWRFFANYFILEILPPRPVDWYA